MKIALIVPEFPSLSQTFVLNQITGLIDRGHDVEIFAELATADANIHQDVMAYNLLQRTCYYREMCRSIPENKLNRILKSIGCIIKYLPMKPLTVLNSINILKYGKRSASFYLLFQIIPFLDKDPYDIIHCHFGPSGNYAVMLKDLGAITGKVVTTFHGYDLSTYLSTQGDHIYKRLFEKGDLFLPISQRWKEKLIRIGCREDRTVVHRMGIDIGKFRFCERTAGNDRSINILTVARLVEKKGVEYGIKAVAKVIERYPEVQYRIAGDGPLKKSLLDLIRTLKIEKNVHLLGSKDQNDILDLMTNSDILLAPSVTSKNGDQEGIPVVLMEAIANGLPAISSFHSGIPELIKDGISGFLVPERDVDALKEKLMQLILKPELRFQMARAGRKYVERHYDVAKLNDRLVRLFEGLLDPKGRNSEKK